jgi:hypothetical protein
MRSSHDVADIRFASANAILKSKGLLGWVCFSYAGLQLDCIRVRQDVGGRYSLGFPTRTDANGVTHPVYRPLDQESRDELEAVVLGELWRRGKLPTVPARSHHHTHAPFRESQP